jgi:superfamily I DNA/RNA helicase
VINDQQDVLQVLDAIQEEHAQALGDGHRIIYGVAGSGKTVLLVARAKRLAQAGHKRVLVTCYNYMLADQLREQLRDYSAVSVKTFHAWAIGQGLSWQPDEPNDAFGERLLTHLTDNAERVNKYDAVLIDEAQDFEPSWFTCLLSAMEDPEHGDLLIVADGCQGLYRRTKISWSQLGIKARGRTISCSYQLDRNYRNSREIIALAETFAFSNTDANDLDAIQSVRVNMSRCELSRIRTSPREPAW